MSRLPPRRRDDLDDAGKAVWDVFVERRGERILGADGALVGPWNAMVTAPHVGAWMQAFAPAMRGASVDRRLIEIAILTTAAAWRAEFEWAAHAELAVDAGVSQDVIDAIVAGTRAALPSNPEQIVHDIAHQLATTGHVDHTTYDEAHHLLGGVGLVELVAVCGFYAFLSFVLNAFDVPPPDGAQPMFRPSSPPAIAQPRADSER